MRRDGVLIVMRSEFVGGPVGPGRQCIRSGNKITNQLYRYSSWDHFERDIYYLFELDPKECLRVASIWTEPVPPARAVRTESPHLGNLICINTPSMNCSLAEKRIFR